MYLSEAEITHELWDCVLAYTPEQIDHSQIHSISLGRLAFYLNVVKKLVGLPTS